MKVVQGILPAAITPFDASARFAPAVLERLLERVYAAGVHGVYVCGTTGEGMLQRIADRQAIVDTAVACTPRDRHVVVHVGAASIDDALALSAHAAKAGARAISSLPPISAQFAFSEVVRYYDTLARASDLPLIVYYFPEVCPSVHTTDHLEALCSLPNVVGVKFTDFDLYKMTLVMGPDRSTFNGRDEVLAAGLLMGADGGIGSFYNLVPELFVQMFDAARAGRWDEVRPLQERVNRLIRVTLRFPLFPAIKQILLWSGLDCGVCLLPRPRLDADQQRVLREGLVEAGFGELIRA
jgi:N-acetylneuraminate lyase